MVDMIAAGRTAMSHGEAAAVPCRISLRRRSMVTTDAPWVRPWPGLLALVLAACSTPAPATMPIETCSLGGVAAEEIPVLDGDPSEWHGRFDLADSPRLWAPAEPDPVVSDFRAAVRARLGDAIDARSLLERQRAIYAVMPAEWQGEATNGTLVLEGRIGAIQPVGCLEAMLWKWQAARYPMLEHPTEFGAFVLVGDGRVRVYLSSADLVGQKIRRPVVELVEADVQAGYRLAAHVHNHPFLFDREVGDRMWTMEGTRDDVAGALAPSMTDVQFFRSLRDRLGLQEAWVTNGLETARFRAEELDVLRAPAEERGHGHHDG